MRIYQEGFELDESTEIELSALGVLLPIAGWYGGITDVFITTITPHTNTKGNGGARSLALGLPSVTSRVHMYGPKLKNNHRYAWIGFAMKVPDVLDSAFGVSVIEGGFSTTAKQVSVVVSYTGTVSVRVGSVVVASSPKVFTDSWHWFALEYFCDETSGFINLYVDDVLEISHGPANTQGLVGTNFWNMVQVQLGVNSQLDDIVINTATLTYSGGSGTPTIGTTVTGGTSTSTAVISRFEETSPGNGYLTLRPTIGSTSGPSGFQSAETLTATGWSATSSQVDIGPTGLDKNSAKPLENFLLLLRPTTDISVQLTGQDANQINNFDNVNDDPFGDITTFNEGTTVGERDIYGLQNIPFSPGEVDAVEVIVYGSRAGSISGIEPGIDPGLGVTYGEVQPVGSGGSFAKGSKIFDVNPDTDLSWDESEVNGSEIAVRLA